LRHEWQPISTGYYIAGVSKKGHCRLKVAGEWRVVRDGGVKATNEIAEESPRWNLMSHEI
jgi:hypothetical protein